MGLSQSSEVSEGGTYGYHVHGVRLRIGSSLYSSRADSSLMLLYANS